MAVKTVWTKQHESVLTRLEQTGRYTATRSGILNSEEARLKMTCYSWLAQAMPQHHRPPDAEFPVWLSLEQAHTMIPSPHTVVLELEVDEALITPVNEAKWSTIANFSYLPSDSADERRHDELLRRCGVSDQKAMMTPFYPAVRQEILHSWLRLFDDRVQVGGSFCDGLVWELRREWLRAVRRP